jgi:hypothetical protein
VWGICGWVNISGRYLFEAIYQLKHNKFGGKGCWQYWVTAGNSPTRDDPIEMAKFYSPNLLLI